MESFRGIVKDAIDHPELKLILLSRAHSGVVFNKNLLWDIAYNVDYFDHVEKLSRENLGTFMISFQNDSIIRLTSLDYVKQGTSGLKADKIYFSKKDKITLHEKIFLLLPMLAHTDYRSVDYERFIEI